MVLIVPGIDWSWSSVGKCLNPFTISLDQINTFLLIKYWITIL